MRGDPKTRKPVRPGMPAPREAYPSRHAPTNFFDRDLPRRMAAGPHVPAGDDESDFGNCMQCGAPQRLSEAPDCWLCSSDNRTAGHRHPR